MSTEQRPADPYETVLADLKAKRAEIDQAIAVIERVRGTIGATETSAIALKSANNGDQIEGNAFFGMTITDAAKKVLGIRQRKMSNVEIANDLKAGGLALQSTDAANTVGSVLTRRFQQVGDIVKVGRGLWGLREWSPHIRYKPKASEDDAEGDKPADQ